MIRVPERLMYGSKYLLDEQALVLALVAVEAREAAAVTRLVVAHTPPGTISALFIAVPIQRICS